MILLPVSYHAHQCNYSCHISHDLTHSLSDKSVLCIRLQSRAKHHWLKIIKCQKCAAVTGGKFHSSEDLPENLPCLLEMVYSYEAAWIAWMDMKHTHTHKKTALWNESKQGLHTNGEINSNSMWPLLLRLAAALCIFKRKSNVSGGVRKSIDYPVDVYQTWFNMQPHHIKCLFIFLFEVYLKKKGQ